MSDSVRELSPLRAIRVDKGLTLAEVAARARLDEGHLSRVERGQAGLSIDTLARLAAALDLHELDLLAPYRRTRGGESFATSRARARKPGRET